MAVMLDGGWHRSGRSVGFFCSEHYELSVHEAAQCSGVRESPAFLGLAYLMQTLQSVDDWRRKSQPPLEGQATTARMFRRDRTARLDRTSATTAPARNVESDLPESGVIVFALVGGADGMGLLRPFIGDPSKGLQVLPRAPIRTSLREWHTAV